jgi:eukaryotic-like serine/threonine-protein kinase
MSEEAEILAVAAQRVGTVLHGKYHLDSVLGVGGMATVFAATHRNRKRFAVKVLHPEFAVRRDVRTRFVREGYVANSVAHPGVVAVLDDDIDEAGAPFLVMELLEGVTVDALSTTSDSAIPVRESLAMVEQLLDVLEAAHQKSVIHRDIKPANLFILRDGQLKVLDFGIARLRDAGTGLKSTRQGALLGTPAFMAPEQALAMAEQVDARSDVWAVGATLFTMLSARFVHPGENARQIMIQAATQPARSIQSIMPDLPGSVVALVSRALAFERSDRWPSAASMRDAVLEAHRGLFGSDPVRADVAALVERTSATVGTQPTQPDPFTESRRPVHERSASEPAKGSTPNGSPAVPRAKQTTASTPVAAIPPAAARKARWIPLALLSGAAALAMGARLGLREPTARTAVPEPVAIVNPAEVARAVAFPSPTAVATPPATAPVPPATASGELVPDPRPAPAKPVSSSTAPRNTPRPPASSTGTASTVAAPAAASLPPENPLKLELQ